MKLNSGTRNFWIQIGFGMLWAGAAAAVVWALELGVGLTLATVILVFTIQLGLFLSTTKAAILQAMPDWQVDVVDSAESWVIHLNWFQQQTQALKDLGFIPLQDYFISPAKTAIARCFAHPQHYCFAEIGQLLESPDQPLPSGVDTRNLVIFSRLDQDWRLSDVQGSPKPMMSMTALWRNPRQIVKYHRDTSLEDLLYQHLRFRQQIVTDLGSPVLTDVSLDVYNREQLQASMDRRKTLERKNLLWGMIQVTLLELNLPLEWLGDYPRAKAKANRRI